MKNRFEGRENRDRRIKILNEQFIVNGNQKFAEYFADHCEVLLYQPSETIISQGNSDNDIYFIVVGSAEIKINNRVIATREKDLHVGEMALLGDASKRSADVVAAEETVAFRVSQKEFTDFADPNPELWRRMAVELSNRLRERSKFIRVPNPKPMIFIASSGASLEKAIFVKEELVNAGLDVKVWNDNELFNLSESTLDSLIEVFDNYDFALFMISGDDKFDQSGTAIALPRDNVILELGMSIGALGKTRSFILYDSASSAKLPTDLKGVTYLPLNFDEKGLTNDCKTLIRDKLMKRIHVEGPK